MVHNGLEVHFLDDDDGIEADDEFEVVDYLSYEDLVELEWLDHNAVAELFLLFPLGCVAIDQLGRVQPGPHADLTNQPPVRWEHDSPGLRTRRNSSEQTTERIGAFSFVNEFQSPQ
ncbi:hypothetical protein CDV36_010245 [Fusarium kuroshium]|uniref:Uncharacterized protein n=3 Tax=Fusarium solani species complex TaxID=232080 RepID=A0A3M2RYX3_9HYPO|nr:hypothetical protein CDV36_010245 [Fusarium kuroshium]RSL76340.1 hypothetical protein CEP51_010040 [Fusarium floridanum]RSL90898.1 hypothetical protein CEP52_014411 [Fusarium oligoseptatum]